MQPRAEFLFVRSILMMATLLASAPHLRAVETVNEAVWQQGFGNRAFALSPDGTQMALGGPNIQQVDVSTGAITRTLFGHEDDVIAVTYIPDGSQLVSVGIDGKLIVWNAATGAPIRSFGAVHGGSFQRWAFAGFSPNAAWAVTAVDGSSRVYIWNVATGELAKEFSAEIPDNSLTTVAISSSGKRIATGYSFKSHLGVGTAFNKAMLWDQNGIPIMWLEGHSKGVWAAAFSPDETQIVTGSEDGTARLWDLATFTTLRTFFRNPPLVVAVTSVAISPDGTKVIASEGVVAVWDKTTGQLLRQFGSGSFALSGNGARLTSQRDVGLRTWDIATSTGLQDYTSPLTQVNGVAFAPDGQSVLSAGGRGQVARMWNAGTGGQIRALAGHTKLVKGVAYSPTGLQVATVSQDETVKLWNASNGALIRTFVGHNDDVNSVSFSPDGSRLLTCSDDRTVRLWNISTGSLVRAFSGHIGPVKMGVFSPSGTYVLTISDDRTARLWNAATGAVVRVFQGEVFPGPVAFSPNEEHMIIGFGNTVTLYNVSSLAPVRNFRSSAETIKSAAFSPNSRLLATGGEELRLWNVDTGSLIRKYVGPVSAINAIAFSPDGAQLAVGQHFGALLMTAVGDNRAPDWEAYR